MLTSFRLAACVVVCVAFAAGFRAHADTITVTISATGSGSFNSVSFQNQTVTFTGQTTTQEIAACEGGSATDGCSYFFNAYSRSFAVPFQAGTISVQGFGTYGTVGEDMLSFSAGTYDLSQLQLGSVVGGLSLGLTAQQLDYGYSFGQSVALWKGGSVGSFVDQNCNQGPAAQCPLYAPTTGGNLVLTVAQQMAYGEVLLSPVDVAPEPAAWTLVGTGLLGGVGVLRRRLGR